MSSSNRRNYMEFPSNFDLSMMDFRSAPLEEIGYWIAQHNMNVGDFKNWVTSNQANHILRHDNRGFEIQGMENFNETGTERAWFKWPTNREQLRNYNSFMRGGNNARNADENVVENSNNNSRIKWDKKFVKNMPTNEAGSLNNFKNGNKVIQYKVGKYNKYISPYTFQKLAKMSPTSAYNKPKTQILFKNPFTRANVKRGEIKFMVLKDAKIAADERAKTARKRIDEALRARAQKARNVVRLQKPTYSELQKQKNEKAAKKMATPYRSAARSLGKKILKITRKK
jgi:hypothetical protein